MSTNKTVFTSLRGRERIIDREVVNVPMLVVTCPHQIDLGEEDMGSLQCNVIIIIITITITIGISTGDLLILCTLNIVVCTSVTPALVHRFLTQAEVLLLSIKCYYYQNDSEYTTEVN